MSVKRIITFLLLTYITDITTGSPYRKTEHSPERRSWGVFKSPHASAAQNVNQDERRNEFEIIQEARQARKSRRNYNPNPSSVRTRGLSRPSSSPFGSAKSVEREIIHEIPSTRNEFSEFSRRSSPALSPERRVVVNRVIEPWQRAPASYAQRSAHQPEEPDYLY